MRTEYLKGENMASAQAIIPNDVHPGTAEVLTADRWQEKVTDLYAQMDRFDERIERNQADTDRLRIETRLLLADLQALRLIPGCS